MSWYSLLAAAAFSFALATSVVAEPPKAKVLKVLRTDDFKVTGDGSAPAWQKAAWEPLEKAARSQGVVPVAIQNALLADRPVRAVQRRRPQVDRHDRKDFEDLWNEDVFEFFLWPDEKQTVYLEYEISPLNHELAILVPHFGIGSSAGVPGITRASENPQGDVGHWWKAPAGGRHLGLDGRSVCPLRSA